MDIKFLKMKSGEEVIATIVDETNNDITIQDPVVLMMHPQEQQMMLVPWLPYADENTFVINKNGVMITSTVKPDIVTAYKQSFSDIITPPNKTLIV